MTRVRPVALWVAVLTQLLLAVASYGSGESSDETETAETGASPRAAAQKPAGKGEPAVEIGTARSPAPIDSNSLTNVPIHLRNAAPAAKPATSRSRFLVAIDIGHTRNHSGAVSARGVAEYELNRRFSRELFESLQSAALFRSLLINPGGGDIGLVKRAQVANDHASDLFLAIHHDSVKNQFLKKWEFSGKTLDYCDDFHGYSIFFSRKNLALGRSRDFAMKLGGELLKAGFTPTLHHVAQEHRPIIDPEKGVYAFDDLLVLKNAKMPAVLLECGVIVNRNEEQQLNSSSYRAKMIGAIEAAVAEFAADTQGVTRLPNPSQAPSDKDAN